jgi:hypothetical protein
MTQIGELIHASLGFSHSADIECPFGDPPAPASLTVEGESPADDDVNHEQANNGQTLGKNMEREGRAGWGRDDTWNERCPPPERIKVRPKLESDGNKELMVALDDFDAPSETRAYDWKAAAHHLIPGEAALIKSNAYKRFMVDGASVEVGDRTFKLDSHIGYNVNGNHNGAWLPGNYAIRRGEYGKNWSELPDDWRFRYAQAVVTKSRKQFHDTHVHYSDNVLAVLDKLSAVLMHHLAVCPDCKQRASGKIAPPWALKNALYKLSRALGAKVRGWPGLWKDPYITSDHYKAMLRQFAQSARGGT